MDTGRREKMQAKPTVATQLALTAPNGQLWGPCRNKSAAVAHDVPISSSQISLVALNERSREIFRQIVDSYLATGEPVGSRHLSRLVRDAKGGHIRGKLQRSSWWPNTIRFP